METVCETVRPRRAEKAGANGVGIAVLTLRDDVVPSWLGKNMSLRVPVPPRPPVYLEPDDVVVWGHVAGFGRLPLAALLAGGLQLAFPWREWRGHVLTEAYADWRRRPVYTRFPVSYRRVPARIRNRIAGGMCRARQRDPAAFPAAPFEPGFEVLCSVVRAFAGEIDNAPPPRICLTHDIDTAEGFSFVKEIAEREISLGLRSSWNVVPFGYHVDYAVCDWLIERGFEIGLHGHCHDNRLIYVAEAEMRRRLDACRPFIERSSVRGFRSPSWFRNMRLMRVLAEYVEYDCSCLDFDWLCPAGRSGVLSAKPFRFGSLVEIPTTLPFEAPLLGGARPDEVVSYWRSKVEWLVATGGQAVVNTHPDPHYVCGGSMIRAYSEFLEELLRVFDGNWSLPRDLADETPSDA